MNAKTTFLGLLAIAGTTMSSCDDNDNWSPEQQITSAFETLYPNATRVEWDRERDYFVADFMSDNLYREAWFNTTGQWMLTETDIHPADLPKAIQDSFNASEYKEWRIEDADLLERPELEDIYVLDIERGEQELDLHYLANGTLLRSSNEKGDAHHTPSSLPSEIRTHIESNFPGARLLDYDIERNGYEVDILHDQKYKDVHFDNQHQWLYTTWDIRSVGDIAEEAVRAAIDTYMAGNGYDRVDDIEYRESPSSKYYAVEFEAGKKEERVNFALDGTRL